MARIRSIKPEFWTSAQVLECSRNARLLFIGLWNFCDDKGRHPYNPKQVKASVFPADDLTEKDVLELLQELSKNGLITRYEFDNKGFFFVPGWHHQRIDKPQKPKYPSPLSDHSSTIPGILPPDTIREDRIGKEKKDGAHAPIENGNGHFPQPTLESDFYKRGRSILGKGSGGLISKLLKAKKGDVALARAALETASTKNDPKEYIGRIIAGHPDNAASEWRSGIPGVI